MQGKQFWKYVVEEMACTGPSLRRRRSSSHKKKSTYWPDFDTTLISLSCRFEWRPSCFFACADRPGSNTCQNSNGERRQTNRKIKSHDFVQFFNFLYLGRLWMNEWMNEWRHMFRCFCFEAPNSNSFFSRTGHLPEVEWWKGRNFCVF